MLQPLLSKPRVDAADLITRIALVGILAALVAFARPAPDVVQAQRLELVNLAGEARAALAADSTGVVLTLFDKRGRAAASIRLDDDPWLSVLDGAGREAAGLGAPRVQHLVQ